jgi:hypothetical protein
MEIKDCNTSKNLLECTTKECKGRVEDNIKMVCYRNGLCIGLALDQVYGFMIIVMALQVL